MRMGAGSSLSLSPTLLIISQVYVPDAAAVGQHLADVAEAMVHRGWRVIVLTASRGYDDPKQRYPAKELRRGVEVYRLPLSSLGKRSLVIRLFAQSLFMLQAVVRSLFIHRPALILASTSPPFAGWGAWLISVIRRVPFVWWVMDINPDQLIATGKLSPRSWLARIFDWGNRLTLQQASRVVTLDEAMRERLLMKIATRPAIDVLPPWPIAEISKAAEEVSDDFRRRSSLDGRFLVMYSGNHALQHPLKTLLDVATESRHDSELCFVFIGGGAGKVDVDKAVEGGASNVVSLPYQPLEQVGASLGAANVHVVSMGNEMVGIVHPCKIYSALAVGKPLLVFGPSNSHLASIVVGNQLGEHVQHDDTAGAVLALAKLRSLSEHERRAIQRRSQELIKGPFRREGLIQAFCDILDSAAQFPGRRTGINSCSQ